MVREFSEALKEVQDSDKYKNFAKKHDEYYLAHGFCQLDKNGEFAKKWQIGFYSPKQDNIASFTTDPVTFQGTEEAFKKEGSIDKLDMSALISSTSAFEEIQKLLGEEYKSEVVNNFIVILQTIEGVPTYNVTAVSLQFNMINIRLDASTGEVLKHAKNSIMELKKED